MAPKTSFLMPISFQAAVAVLIFMFTTIIPIRTYSFRMKLIPIDSIDSVHFPKNLTLEERHQRLIELSKAHVLHLRSITSASTVNSTEVPMNYGVNMIQPSIILSHNYYISQFVIGSQQFSPYLLVDTGSHMTWVQADRCTNCFPVRGGNFKYYQSSTFRPLPCGHPLCVPRICRQGICHYELTYHGFSSKGWVSSDTFTFSGINRTTQRFSSIVFGIGFDNPNVTFGPNDGPNNVIAGIFGLGSGRRSFLRQLSGLTRMRFSYCLPSWLAPSGTHTFLRFGDDANFRRDLSRWVQSTRLLPGEYQYYVNLLGISVEGRRLNIDQSVFQLNPDHTGGFGIDSGCPHSVLVEPAYRILKAEMVRYIQQHFGWRPLQGRAFYDLCYARPPPGGNYTLPSITYHFQGANLFLHSAKVFDIFNDRFCMIILPARGRAPSLLGAFQQADFRFLFDFESGRVSFAPDNCINN